MEQGDDAVSDFKFGREDKDGLALEEASFGRGGAVGEDEAKGWVLREGGEHLHEIHGLGYASDRSHSS